MSFSYTKIAEHLDTRPNFRADWPRLALVLALGYAATFAVRLLEIPNWNLPELLAGGERILATHDAYCWLAGAKGVNGYADFGMSRLATGIAALTGAPLWRVGFLAPVFLGSLTAIAAGLWGWLLGGRTAALLPALLGALSPGFYYRSRVGYYDSDVFTQLMPLLLGFFLAALLASCCSRAWLPARDEAEAAPPSPALPWLALCFGLAARVAHFAHDDIHALGLGLFWLALGLAALTALPGRRTAAFRLLAIYALAAYAGPRRFGMAVFDPGLTGLAGMALAAALAWALWRRPAFKGARLLDSPWPWLCGIGALAFACGMLLPLAPFLAKAASYFKPVAEAGMNATAGAPAPPSYPGITQSIREARNVADMATALAGLAPGAGVGALALAGVVALFALRPAALLLSPMAALGFSSLYFGTRFTMFGGPVFALGLGVGLSWTLTALARRFHLPGFLPALAQGLAGAVILLLVYAPTYMDTRPTPVLGRAHAEALLACRDIAPRDADVWTWWDFGYATQYFAERMTPSDGGKHSGRHIYPTALALSTGSYRQAAQMIRLAASEGGDPSPRWDAMGGAAAKAEVERLAREDIPLPKTRPQLLVVCWEDIPLLYWISFYGGWNLAQGQGRHASVLAVRGDASLDKATGELVRGGGDIRTPLASAEILSQKGVARVPLPEHGEGAPHLLLNKAGNQALLLDDAAYSSMAVQLLLGDPARPEAARYFKLLHEGFPLVRIYEVLPGESASGQAKAATK